MKSNQVVQVVLCNVFPYCCLLTTAGRSFLCSHLATCLVTNKQFFSLNSGLVMTIGQFLLCSQQGKTLLLSPSPQGQTSGTQSSGEAF